MVIVAVLFVVSMRCRYGRRPRRGKAVTAQMIGEDLGARFAASLPPRQPRRMARVHPLLTLVVVALAGGWLAQEFATKDPDPGDLQSQHLQLDVPDARRAAALAAAQLPQCGRQGGAGDHRAS